MKKLIAMLLALCIAATALACNAHTPEALAEQFIAVVNAKDQGKQKALIHPSCFQGLSAVQRQFLNEVLARDFRETIPQTRTAKVTKLDEGELPFSGMVVWPTKPTHQLEIEFSTGEHSSTSIIRFIAKEKDQWFIIVPMANDENLKKYEEKKKSQPVAPPDKK